MRIIEGLSDVSSPFERPVIAVGNFDGVHIGHVSVIELVRQRSAEIDGTSVVITFNPHPRSFFNPECHEPMITTLEQRIELIGHLGVDVLIIQPFNRDFASMPAKKFVENVLVKRLGIAEIFVSGKFRFGIGASGDVGLLERMAAKYGFKVEVIDNIQFRHKVVSSSFVRQVLLKGEMDVAMRLLGRPYSISGRVYSDTQRGTEVLHFPTCNIQPVNELIPATGIYAGAVLYSGVRYPAATYIGRRPTFGGGETVVETHILDFSADLYDKQISIEFFRKIREDMKFDSPSALQAQIEADIEEIKSFLLRHEKDPDFPRLAWQNNT